MAPPTIAFLVLAHDRPAALKALLDDLAATHEPVFLHADRSGHDLDAHMAAFAAKAVCMPRRAAGWGAYSLVTATLNMLEAAHRQTAARYFVLLSNACVPVRPFHELHDLLAVSDREFIDVIPLDSPAADRQPRLDRYHFMRKHAPLRLSALLNEGLQNIPRRPFAASFGQPRFGGQWWALSRPFVAWLLAYRRDNPRFDRRHRMTQFPEESYFQTALYGSPFAGRIAPGLTYTDWSAGGSHPKLLDASDMPAIEASDRFFARKMLREADPGLAAALSARWRGAATT